MFCIFISEILPNSSPWLWDWLQETKSTLSWKTLLSVRAVVKSIKYCQFFLCEKISSVLCSSNEPDVEATLDKMFDKLAFNQNDSKWRFKKHLCDLSVTEQMNTFSAVTRPRVLNVHNRKVGLRKACGTIADCTFEELCDRVSPDCFKLSQHLHSWFSALFAGLTLQTSKCSAQLELVWWLLI